VLAVVPDAWGWYRVRLQFRKPCPDAILAAASDEEWNPEPAVQTGELTTV
jgi:hypothetical protein